MKDGIKITGDVIIETRRKDGSVKQREVLKNLIVNSGKERVSKLLAEGIGTGLTGFNYIAIGTGETGDSVNASDTALKTEVDRALATITYVANYKAQFEKTFTFATGEEYAITEAGIGDSASSTGDTLLDRFVFSEKNVDIDTDLYVKITITVS